MTDTPVTALPTVDSTAQLVDTDLVTLGQKGITAGETALIVQYPILGFWALKWIWEVPLQYFAGQILKFFGTLGGYVAIDVQKYFAMQKALAAQVALDAAKKTGDPNAIAQASSDVDAAVAPILHYVGSFNVG